jgi:hypothetical protein
MMLQGAFAGAANDACADITTCASPVSGSVSPMLAANATIQSLPGVVNPTAVVKNNSLLPDSAAWDFGAGQHMAIFRQGCNDTGATSGTCRQTSNVSYLALMKLDTCTPCADVDTLIALWPDGTPLVAALSRTAGGRVLALNFFPGL